MAFLRASTLIFFLLAACNSDTTATPSELDGGVDANTDAASSTDAGADSASPVEYEPGFCARIAGGPTTSLDPALALSTAHARVRYYGAEATNAIVDNALVAAIDATDGTVTALTAREFATRLDSVCYVEADTRALAPARIDNEGELVVVVPGTGDVVIPETANLVALDLRELPDAPGLDDALTRAVAPFLDGSLRSTNQIVQGRAGLTDEAFTAGGYYDTFVGDLPAATITGTGTHATATLIVLVGERIAPAAALLAARLRRANRAWVVGDDLPVGIAESEWVPTGEAGISYRRAMLQDDDGTLPDLIPADHALPSDLAELATLSGAPPASASGTMERAPIRAHRDFGVTQHSEIREAQLRAALISAHGAAKLFFPYFDTIGDHSDERLLETLALAEDVTSRAEARKVLRRFGNVLADGHNWVLDTDPSAQPTSFVPIMVDPSEGAPVISRSFVSWLSEGDTILTIDGEPALDWYATEMARSYGATEGFRFVNATKELTIYSVPALMRVRAYGGAERDVFITPVTTGGGDLFAGSMRHSGWLTDLGAPTIYYFNLDGRYVPGDSYLNDALTDAAEASGIVLDMRGHPANGGSFWDAYAFLQRIVRMSFDSPRYRVPIYLGGEHVDDAAPYMDSYDPIDTAPTFAGPVVLITDHMAVSFAEDFSIMLVGAGRARVVGRPTAGTTGSVSGMQLPGGFNFMLTGMEARWPDGSVFFGRGVIPDVMVTPTAEDFAMGRDAFIAAAIADLSGG